MSSARGNGFGTVVVEQLLPHRPPMRLVDGVERFLEGPPATLRAWRVVSATEPWCDGHFPGQPVLPGVLLIEGLAQACGLVRTLQMLAQALAARGEPGLELGQALTRLAADPSGGEPTASAPPTWLSALLAQRRAKGLGALVSVKVKLLRPVLPGERLTYEVTHRKQVDRLGQFDVRATVGAVLAARGAIALGPLELPRWGRPPAPRSALDSR